MPARKRINLEKVMASLATACPQCGHEITPAEVLRINSTQVRCPKCGANSTREESNKFQLAKRPNVALLAPIEHNSVVPKPLFVIAVTALADR